MSSLFRFVSELHGERPWGHVLDAGTGRNSLRWVATLGSERWTAVTGAVAMAAQARAAAGAAMRPADRIVVGNWIDPGLLAGESFDTVLADYLVGAVEGFAPYGQDTLLRRLRSLTRGRLYLIGLEPYVPLPAPADPGGRLVWEIGRLRDACLLLAGERPYREFPLAWVLDRLARCGFRIVAARRFPIRYGRRFVDGQIAMCRERALRLADRTLGAALDGQARTLQDRALAVIADSGGLRLGEDYVVAAEPA